MGELDNTSVDFWRKRAVKQALKRGEDRSPINLWNGTRITKFPSDCMAIHTLLFRCRPQVVIELGTSHGGSAAFMASFAKQAGIEHIFSLDISEWERPQLEGVTFITGDDTAPEIAEQVQKGIGDRTCSLVIDADHNGPHVFKELEIYGPMVTPGQALVLEDTHVDVFNYKKFRADGGPLRAMKQWLPKNPDFRLVKDIEPYLTTNFFGYWQRAA